MIEYQNVIFFLHNDSIRQYQISHRQHITTSRSGSIFFFYYFFNQQNIASLRNAIWPITKMKLVFAASAWVPLPRNLLLVVWSSFWVAGNLTWHDSHRKFRFVFVFEFSVFNEASFNTSAPFGVSQTTPFTLKIIWIKCLQIWNLIFFFFLFLTTF